MGNNGRERINQNLADWPWNPFRPEKVQLFPEVQSVQSVQWWARNPPHDHNTTTSELQTA